MYTHKRQLQLPCIIQWESLAIKRQGLCYWIRQETYGWQFKYVKEIRHSSQSHKIYSPRRTLAKSSNWLLGLHTNWHSDIPLSTETGQWGLQLPLSPHLTVSRKMTPHAHLTKFLTTASSVSQNKFFLLLCMTVMSLRGKILVAGGL